MAVKKKSFAIAPVGQVKRAKYGVQLRIDAQYRPALKHLGRFSHVIVLWWAEKFDDAQYRSILQTRPFYAEKVLTGIFATRSPIRPNPVASTVCKILDVDEEEGVVVVSDIDAYDGTPIIDLKGYFPIADKVCDPRIPDWLPAKWYECVPDEGEGPDQSS